MSLFRSFISGQVAMCRSLDRMLFPGMSTDGNGHYLSEVARLVPSRARIADVGGGKRPFFPPGEVAMRGLRVTGIDIDADELASAPAGSYHEVVVSALEEVHGPGSHDVVIAQSVLEHVTDGRAAIRGCASLLTGGGYLYTFCPNRFAWFAILNRLLPESAKRAILFAIFPEKREKQGFPAYYDGCVPAAMRGNMEDFGLEIVNVEYFFVSSYFMFFFPLYLFWRVVTFPFMKLRPQLFCETFMITARKK